MQSTLLICFTIILGFAGSTYALIGAIENIANGFVCQKDHQITTCHVGDR